MPHLCQEIPHQVTSCNPKFHMKANPVLNSTKHQLTNDLPHSLSASTHSGFIPPGLPPTKHTAKNRTPWPWAALGAWGPKQVPPPLQRESRTIQQLPKHSPITMSAYNQPHENRKVSGCCHTPEHKCSAVVIPAHSKLVSVIRPLFAFLSLRGVSQGHCN